jgi:hypothetical protein
LLLLLPLQHSPSLDVNKCVPRFDHHCPWVGNTIGYKNHPMFLAYTASVFTCLLTALRTEWWFLTDRLRHNGHWAAGSFYAYPWVDVSFVICVFYTLFTLALFGSQAYTTVMCNLTTNENMNRNRYPHFIDPATGMQRKTHPFDRGAVANIRMFFHLTAADEAMCLQCDEPEAEMAA